MFGIFFVLSFPVPILVSPTSSLSFIADLAFSTTNGCGVPWFRGHHHEGVVYSEMNGCKSRIMTRICKKDCENSYLFCSEHFRFCLPYRGEAASS